MQATLTSACPQTDSIAAGHDKSRLASSKLINTIGKAIFVAAAGAAMALGGAAAAAAQPGVVDVQSGSSVDVDGTQGSWAPATTGTQRPLTTHASAGHTIQSDACYVKKSSVYCPPPSSFEPETISATTGISNDRNAKLDPDGFQADAVR